MKFFLATSGIFLEAFRLVSGQDNTIESLQQEVRRSTTDSARIIALKDISWEYLNKRDQAELARTYIDSFHSLSRHLRTVVGYRPGPVPLCRTGTATRPLSQTR